MDKNEAGINENKSELARRLQAAIGASNESVDQLAERTKVPRTTILALIEEPVAAVLPGRVYMRGHMKVLAQALKLDVSSMTTDFDTVYPVAKAANDVLPAQPARNIAVSAGLYGIALIAVAVAFVTALS